MADHFSAMKTVAYFGDEIEAVIEINIPEAFCLMAETTALQSDKFIVGTSAWSLIVNPEKLEDNNDVSSVNTAGLYIKHEFLQIVKSQFRARFEITVSPATACEAPFIRKTAIFNPKNTEWVWGCNILLKSSTKCQLSPTLKLYEGSLKVFVAIKYSPVRQTAFFNVNEGHALQEKMRNLLNSDYGKDFILVSSDGEERQVHRLFLTENSTVFRAMFESNMDECRTGRCEMTDVSSETLDALLNFVYSEETNMLKTGARDVLVTADKYQMDRLKQKCEHILMGELSNETAAEMLLWADQVNAGLLKNAALRYIAGNLKKLERAGLLKLLFDEGDKKLIQETLVFVARKC